MKKISRKYNVLKYVIVGCLFTLILLLYPQAASAAEVSVTTWAEFKTAYEDQTVTKITLANDISYTSTTPLTMTRRTADLEIDGTKSGTNASEYNNYKLDLGYTSMQIAQPTSASTATFNLKNITVSNQGDNGTGNRAGFIETPSAYDVTDNYQYGKYWNFNIENVYVPDGKTSRLIRCPRSQINVSGTNKLYTTAENFYTGGMYFAPDTIYYGEITVSNYSVIWFKNMTATTDTGTGDFVIGDNADVKLRNVRRTENTDYPAVYEYYKDFIVGENASYTASVPGAAVTFCGDGQTFTAKKGSKVTLTSLSNYPSISDSVKYRIFTYGDAATPRMNWSMINAQNMSMNFEAGSSLYVIGKTNTATTSMVQLGSYTGATNNKITLDSPEQFDIRNNGTNTNYDAVQVLGSNTNSFSVTNSNLAFWKLKSSFSSTADYDYSDVTSFSIGPQNTITSSESSLQTALTALRTTSRTNVSRINGLNSKPSIEWQYRITDANKILTNIARVIIGIVPDDTGLDSNGDLHFITQYANADLPVTMTNSENTDSETLSTDSNGYVSLTRTTFPTVGMKYTAIATRGKLVSDASDSETAFKITPPVPATVTKGAIYNTDSSIVGSGAEAGATVYVDVNGTRLEETTTVAEDGSYSYPLKNKLAIGDKVIIYLQDHVGVAPTKLKNLPAPTTNSSIGNINPSSSLVYSDATFPAATAYTVEKGNSILTIQFEDEAGTVLDGYTLTAGEATTNSIATPVYVGDTIDLTSATFKKVQDQLTSLQTAGYELVTRPTNETALPITDVTQTVTYTVKGLLFLKSAPSKVDFGSLTYNAKTQRVDNPTTTGDLVITDTRATKTNGWTLYAAVTTEMKNASTGSIMSDALRYVTTAGNEVTLSSSNQAVYTNTTGGTTDITSSWGTTSDTAGLKLVADPNKTTVSSVGTYSGVITWTIMAGQP